LAALAALVVALAALVVAVAAAAAAAAAVVPAVVAVAVAAVVATVVWCNTRLRMRTRQPMLPPLLRRRRALPQAWMATLPTAQWQCPLPHWHRAPAAARLG